MWYTINNVSENWIHLTKLEVENQDGGIQARPQSDIQTSQLIDKMDNKFHDYTMQLYPLGVDGLSFHQTGRLKSKMAVNVDV
jgi:hypothetical protein